MAPSPHCHRARGDYMEQLTHATAFMPRRGNTLSITCEAMRQTSFPRGDVSCLQHLTLETR
ncbi:hypothetical protein [Nostoc sp.]|uniref:hypothetical protein n=1 Tax=Nostoc sp. TaxID=1180 RepID=UPI002FFAD2E5